MKKDSKALLYIFYLNCPWREVTIYIYCLENRLDMSIYINRLVTFSNWPRTSPVSEIRLSQAGFFYTGSNGIVKCCCCGIRLYEFVHGDDVLQQHKLESPDCEFIRTLGYDNNNLDSESEVNNNTQDCHTNSNERRGNGVNGSLRGEELLLQSASRNEDVPNVPGASESMSESLPNLPNRYRRPEFSQIISRIESFQSWLLSSVQPARQLVEAGFYYTGREDIVRCFCCDIGLADWDKDDDPWVEHARHSPQCTYLIAKRGQNFVDQVQSQWRQVYSPRHQSLSDYNVRVRTFQHWPLDSQSPDQLARAGFFYTGQDDGVRCHYCDGGLRNWEPDDDPWVEHARWFPHCKFVSTMKGEDFIKAVVDRQTQEAEVGNSGDCSHRPSSRNDNCHCQLENVRNILQTPAAQSLLENGFSPPVVIKAISLYFKRYGVSSCFTALRLIQIINDNELDEKYKDDGAVSRTNSFAMYLQLQDYHANSGKPLCMICKSREANVVFLPCGHIIACQTCSRIPFCLSCGLKVDKRTKIFLA